MSNPARNILCRESEEDKRPNNDPVWIPFKAHQVYHLVSFQCKGFTPQKMFWSTLYHRNDLEEEDAGLLSNCRLIWEDSGSRQGGCRSLGTGEEWRVPENMIWIEMSPPLSSERSMVPRIWWPPSSVGGCKLLVDDPFLNSILSIPKVDYLASDG